MAGKAVTRSNCLNDAGSPQAVIHNIQKPQTGLLVADCRTGEVKEHDHPPASEALGQA
jgi:hypothetical protein